MLTNLEKLLQSSKKVYRKIFKEVQLRENEIIKKKQKKM